MDKPRTGNNFFDELMVVLVLYKIEIQESPAVISLTTALQTMQKKASMFIYDNSENAHTHTPKENWLVTYQHDLSNPGVSKAYNEGFKCAKAQNKNWILLVDQDSEFEKDFFLKAWEAVDVDTQQKLFVPIMIDEKGIVSPFHFHFGRGVRLNRISPGKYDLAQKKFINSGTLISIDLFELAGGFDERYKLDFSDLAFIQRLKKHQNQFVVINSFCKHHLSSQEERFSKAKNRFSYFIKASRLYGDTFGSSFFLSANRFFRAVKLFLKFRSMEFLKLLIQTK